jgi:hypothetical protein
LREREDAWINSSQSDEYGANSYFVHRYYSDEEKRVVREEPPKPLIGSRFWTEVGFEIASFLGLRAGKLAMSF